MQTHQGKKGNKNSDSPYRDSMQLLMTCTTSIFLISRYISPSHTCSFLSHKNAVSVTDIHDNYLRQYVTKQIIIKEVNKEGSNCMSPIFGQC